MSNFNRHLFSRIHRDAYYVGKLQTAINAEFQKAMEKIGLNGSTNEKPLSIIKLMSSGLITFTVPENTKFVVNERLIHLKNGGEYNATGFMNANKKLVGWGFIVWYDGDTSEAMWDGHETEEKFFRDVQLHPSKNYSCNRVQTIENSYLVLGRNNFSSGSIKYYFDNKWSTNFNQEADDYANSVYECLFTE